MGSTLPERLRDARSLVADLSARELDRLAGLREGHTALIESNVRPNVEAKTAQSLARVLGISLDWLINGEGKGPIERSVKQAVTAARDSFDADQTGPRPALPVTRTG